MKKTVCFLIVSALLITAACAAQSAGDFFMEEDTVGIDPMIFDVPASATTDVSAPSAILMERSTGTVIFSKNAAERLAPASITKIMTLLLIAEAVDGGRIALTDQVTASAYAASMGGSQVYLKEGEKFSVDDMIKSIAVSSANDCAVAMAEFLAGSEASFAGMMNEKAAALGMTDTHFSNCSGLLDNGEHYSSAEDIAVMARELLSHEWIKNYTTIWTDSVRGGAFGLTNTNKLVRYYDGATGLKTGFTAKAGYCLAASAERDGTEFIAVVLNCPTSEIRFMSARSLLDFAFANYTVFDCADGGEFYVPVKIGVGKSVRAVPDEDTRLVAEKGRAAQIKSTVTLTDGCTAPVRAGDELGCITVRDGDAVIKVIKLRAEQDVLRITWAETFLKLLKFAAGKD